MRNVIPNIAKSIANISVAAGLGAMTLFGGVAHATTVQQRAEAELNNGKDYTAAWQAATRAISPAYAPDLAANAKKAADALNAGKDYVAAWESEKNATDTVGSPEQIAKAKQVEDGLNAGKDYVAAHEATAGTQPARVVATGTSVETAGTHQAARTVR